MKKLTDPERLASLMRHIDQTGGPDACWPWTHTARTINAGGYPLARWNNRTQTVPRIVMCITRSIPDLPGLVARHTCDNPACCNPAHLIPGDHRDNMRDCIERGRRAKRYRPHTRRKKLSDNAVRAIRADTRPLADIAAEHGISLAVASTVRRRLAKAGVPD